MTKLLVRGYHLPDDIVTSGTLLPWLKDKSALALRKMDRGDPLDPGSTDTRAKDRKLARIEIFNALIDDYRLATGKAVRAGVKGNWQAWEKHLKVKDALAQAVQELGWHPVFHIADREYQRRIVELIRQEPLKDFNSVKRLYYRAASGWKKGGLCLDYPKDLVERGGDWTAEQNVTACKSNNSQEWGECNGSARKIVALMEAALSIYHGPPFQIQWVHLDDNAPRTRGHSFISIRQAQEQLPLDPAGIGYTLTQASFYQNHAPYLASLSFYYVNQGVALGKHGSRVQKEVFYRKATQINPRDYFAWNNLAYILKLQSRWNESAEAFRRALAIHPFYQKAVKDLPEVLEKLRANQ